MAELHDDPDTSNPEPTPENQGDLSGQGDLSRQGDLPKQGELPDVFEADLPPLIRDEDSGTKERFLEFFLAEIRNENTRRAYGRAVDQFLSWAERQGLALQSITPLAVSAYVEKMDRQDGKAPATVKQHLSAIKRLLGWLQAGNVLESNPADRFAARSTPRKTAPPQSSPPRRHLTSSRDFPPSPSRTCATGPSSGC